MRQLEDGREDVRSRKSLVMAGNDDSLPLVPEASNEIEEAKGRSTVEVCGSEDERDRD